MWVGKNKCDGGDIKNGEWLDDTIGRLVSEPEVDEDRRRVRYDTMAHYKNFTPRTHESSEVTKGKNDL